MTDNLQAYRQRYLDRGIPLLDQASCAPYAAGETPREGWYIIEVSGESRMPDPTREQDPEHPACVTELLDEEAIRQLCDRYDPSVNGGNGPLINKDHLMLRNDAAETKAEGWIKALDYYVTSDGQVRMAGYNSMTPSGYDLIRDQYYWAWSTEYLLSDYYDRGGGRWSPRCLSGLALTNNPDHASQPGISHSLTRASGARYVIHSALSLTTNNNKPYMPNNTRRVTHSDPPADPSKEEQTNTNSEDPTTKEEQTNANSADPAKDEQTNCNSDDASWMDIADQIAAVLGLGDESSGDDIVSAVKALKDDCDLLKAGASTGANTNSDKQRAPRMLHSRGAQRMDKKTSLPADKVMHTADNKAYNVSSPELDKVAHCRKATGDLAASLGRPLNPSEFNSAWTRAGKDFDASNAAR